MENATKALIMVANLMLAVIILSVVVYFFQHISILPAEEDRVKKAEQIQKFNLEYEVYDKKLMYGVDVISALNKANSNNEKYVEGNFLSGTKSGEEYIIDIVVYLKTPLEGSLTVSYLSNNAYGEVKEEDYLEGQGIDTITLAEVKNQYKNFILPDSFRDLPLLTRTIHPNASEQITGEQHLLKDGEYKKSAITEETKLKKLVQISDSMRQYIKNTDQTESKLYNEGWSSLELRTELYDLKSRKFKCVKVKNDGGTFVAGEGSGIYYNEDTGVINKIEFLEI